MATHNNGLAAFKAKLAKVPAAIRREVDKANEQNAEEWVQLSRALAPTDPKDGTPLRDSIRHHPSDTGGQFIRAGGPTTMKETPSGPYDYAVAQEFGTAEMRASPFFWPAYRALRSRFNSRRRRALNKAVKVFSDAK